MNWKKNISLFALLISTALAGGLFFFLPGLFTGSWLVFSLWGVVYMLFAFPTIDVNQWHSTKNMVRLTASLLISFSLTTILFCLGFAGSRFFWKDLGNNSRHHFLVHEGFVSSGQQPLYIAGNMYADVQAGLEGRITLVQANGQFSLNCTGIPYPLYVSKQSDNNTWHLQQSGLPSLQAGQQLLIKMTDTGPVETIQVQSAQSGKNKFDFNITYKGVTDTIKQRIIAYGTRFSDLLENTSLPISYDIIQSLQRLYLLKTAIQFATKNNYESPVSWYYGKDPTYQYWQTKLVLPQPASLQLTSPAGNYDLTALQYQDKTIALGDHDRFYFGYEAAAGKQFLQQPAFSVELIQPDRFALKYLQPQIFALPDDRGRNHEVFITTHNRFALERAGYAGYILPALNFENTDSNYNHFWGTLQYSSSDAGDNVSNARFRSGELQPVQSDSSWTVTPASGSAGWLLQLHNSWVNVAGDYLNTVLPFLIVLIASFLFLFFYTKRFSDEKNSGTPVFFWWLLNIILYFFLLRLFLSWRLRSYPYTEAISKNEYNDFISKSYLKTSLLGISMPTNLLISLLILLALLVFLFFQFAKPSKN